MIILEMVTGHGSRYKSSQAVCSHILLSPHQADFRGTLNEILKVWSFTLVIL